MSNQSKEKILFEKIYQLAKDKNEAELQKIANAGEFSLHFLIEDQNVIMRLAREGNHDAVEFLIDRFKASRNYAVKGYSQGGHIDFVNEQLEAGANPAYATMGYAKYGYHKQVNLLLSKKEVRWAAVRGYAAAGYIDQVNKLIYKGIESEAVFGYAFGGYTDQVKQLIQRNEALIVYAVQGYAYGGHFGQVKHLMTTDVLRYNAAGYYAEAGFIENVEELIASSDSTSRHFVAVGYAAAGFVAQANAQIAAGANRDNIVYTAASYGHVDHVNALIAAGASKMMALSGYNTSRCFDKLEERIRLAALTNDPALRDELLKSLDGVLKEVAILNDFIQKYQLSYKEAKALATKDIRPWLLKGPEMVKNGSLPKDIFYEITSQMMNVSIKAVKKILPIFNKRLFVEMGMRNLSEFNGGFFNYAQFKNERKIIENRYQRRMKF